MFRYSVIVALSLVVSSCSFTKREDWRIKTQDPAFVHRSVKQVTDVIVHDIFSPPVASRIYAYMSIAGYEVAIHQDARYVSLAGQLRDLGMVPQPDSKEEYSFPLATVQAMLK